MQNQVPPSCMQLLLLVGSSARYIFPSKTRGQFALFRPIDSEATQGRVLFRNFEKALFIVTAC